MTHDRTATIPLVAAEPRCEPAKPAACVVRGRCDRYQSDIKRGSPLGDYSGEIGGGTLLCPGFLDSGAVRSAASVVPTRPVRKAIGVGD